jgi:CheY-like chemotaxis protein
MTSVLVIDDSPTIRKLVELSFRGGADWKLSFAPTGQAGVDAAQSLKPRLVLLDYVLPDMTGVDVCDRISRVCSPEAELSVILMTAKDENVREQFRSYPFVVDFIAKPFKQEDIVGRARSALTPRPKTTRPTSIPASGRDLRGTLEQALYGALRARCALIPDLMKDMGTATPGAFFARRLLTPELLDTVLAQIGPALNNLRGSARSQVAHAVDGSLRFSGALGQLSVLDVMGMLKAGQHSGDLEVLTPQQRLRVTFRAGEMIFVTTHDPVTYESGVRLDIEIPARIEERAHATQKATGRPVYLTYCEEGLISPVDAARLVYEQGHRALLSIVDAPDAELSFREEIQLPADFIEPTRGHAIEAVRLIALRRRTSIGSPVGAGRDVFERASGFSSKVRSFDLIDEERRVLATLDGKATVAEIQAKTALPQAALDAALWRLSQVGLIKKQSNVQVAAAERIVAIADSDSPTREALEQWVRDADPLAEILVAPSAEEIERRLRAGRIDLLLLNATEQPDWAERLSDGLRATAAVQTAQLVGILDYPNPDLAERLVAAGFDEVLTKPLHIDSIGTFLSRP